MLAYRNLIAASLGLLAHNVIFIRGEWHRQAPGLFVLSFTLPLVLWVLESRHDGQSIYGAFQYVVGITGSFFAALYSSMVIYRLFFHRLRNYPGPLLARVTKLWHFYHCRGTQNHLLMERLRKQYGDHVRIGPNELAIFTPDALQAMDSPKSQCVRAPFYDFLLPEVSLETTRSFKMHDWRRKVWVQGLTESNLDIYHERILQHADELDAIIEQSAESQQSMEVRLNFQRFAFDCIGDITFSESFDTLTSEKWRFAIDLLRGATLLMGQMTPVPWAHQIHNTWFTYFGPFNGMKQWGATKIDERMPQGTNMQDWASHAIKEAYAQGSTADELLRLKGDSVSLIASGSDPIAGTLSCAFYRLAMHPEKAAKVYEEVRSVPHTDRKALQNCQYLDAFLMEVLRLHPVLLTGGLRDTPPQGTMIGDNMIPGSVTLQVPRYSIARSEQCFVRPTDFIPERWTTEDHLVLDKRGFLPFGQGRYQCLGRRLAFVEIRMIITMLLTKYTVRAAPGEDGTRMHTMTRDQFAANPGPFEALFELRKA